MKYNENDTNGSLIRPSHPLQFAIWAIAITLIFVVGIRSCFRPIKLHTLLHPFSPYTTLHDAQVAPWKTFTVEPKETLLSVFKRANLTTADYYKTIQIPEAKELLKNLKPTQVFYFLIDQNNQLQKLIYKNSHTEYLEIIYPNNKPPEAKVIKRSVNEKIETISGTVQNSFAAAANKANLPNALVAQLTNVFSWEIDFARQIQPGDKFAVIYEQYFVDGQPSSKTKLLAAEIETHNHHYEAIQYKNQSGAIQYYTPQGNNLEKTLLRTPLHYKYISSPFNEHRMHPILHILRPHEGVDLAAPLGTPVKAAGDGTVIFRGRRGGYGKVVVILHGHHYSTLYAHLSRFSPNFHIRSHVKKGDIIAYVGQTGLATGPHLHYEVRINGIHYNPMTVRLPHANAIAVAERKTFLLYAQKLDSQLNKVLS